MTDYISTWFERHWEQSPTTQDRRQAEKKLIDVLFKYDEILELIGKWNDCKKIRQHILSIARKRDDKRNMARAGHVLGNIDRRLANFDNAIRDYEGSLAEFQALDDQYGIANVLRSIGILHRQRGEFTAAMDYLNRARDQFVRLEKDRDAASISSNIAFIHAAQGDVETAILMVQNYLTIGEQEGNKRIIASSLANLGSLYREIGAYDQAVALYQKALPIAKDMGDKLLFTSITASIGFLYHDIGNFDAALVKLNHFLAMNQELNDKNGIGVALGNIGNVYLRCGEPLKGLQFLEQAIKIHTETGFLYGLTYWLKNKAQFLLDQNNLDEARRCAENSLDLSTKISKSDTIFESKIILATIDYAAGSKTTAIKTIEDMIANAETEEHLAELRYTLFQFNVSPEINRQTALQLFQKLFDKTPHFEYQQRIEELRMTNWG